MKAKPAQSRGWQAFQKYNRKLLLHGFRPKQAVTIDHSSAIDTPTN
jgi:hypothetical protein